ncbi:MAG TPA: M15 family metallopeptidase [Candidatus Megaira endosymbiont of Hartmannula sinica]|nr:M15 family metallopeptidase [Candidatus Megaera endosymbiont of Hartmannula sinica]
MNDNNSYCFNYRKIANSNKLSMHAKGLAIVINPLQNPCIIYKNDNSKDIDYILPYNINTSKYLDKNNSLRTDSLFDGVINLEVVDIFKRNGFIWGGEWNNPVDYHHFEYKEN